MNHTDPKQDNLINLPLKGVTELCADHPNLLEYVSGLERKLLHAKCDDVEYRLAVEWLRENADDQPEWVIKALHKKQLIKSAQDRYDDVARWKKRCATIEYHYATLRAELVEREARNLHGTFQAAANGKDMEYCRTLANAKLRGRCLNCEGWGEKSQFMPDGSVQSDPCTECEGLGFVEIPHATDLMENVELCQPYPPSTLTSPKLPAG